MKGQTKRGAGAEKAREERPKSEKAELSDRGRASAEDDDERDGAPRGGGRTPREAEEGKEVLKPQEEIARAARSGRATRRKAPTGPKHTGGKTVQVYLRMPEAMLAAAEKAVADSPIEFGSVSEFIRRAIEEELRRRKLIALYK